MSEADVTAPKKLVVIDGKSVFYRGYYAMPNLATKDGTPTGGVYGFAVMALEVIKRLKPDYVAVAWDKPKTNIRKRLELYPAYKAGRKPAPADFYEQIPLLHELLDAFGWPLYELDDYEADDIMGTLAVQAREQHLETLLVTSDLDMLQLVNGNVKVYALKKGLSNIELYSPDSFKAKYGIDVHQFLDLKSLKGDSSDNIPGVPGIGEKTAVQLLQEYGTLENIYDNLGLIKDSVRRKLEAGKDLAYLSQKLAAIWTDAPLPLDLDAMDMSTNIQPEKVLQLLQKFEFRTLARQLPEVVQVSIADARVKGTESRELHVGENILIDSTEKLSEVKFAKSEQIIVHSRAAGKHGKRPQVLMLSSDAETTYTLDLTKLHHAKVLESLSTVFHLPSSKLIGYDLKYTYQVLLELGLTELPPVAHDVLIGAFDINALRREQSLSALARDDLDYDGEDFENIDNEEILSRAAEFIAVIHVLNHQQRRVISETEKMPELVQKIDWPAIPVLARMEHAGIKLDTDYLKAFSVEVADMISDFEQQIYGYAEKEFNIASPAQLAEVLFDTLQLPTQGIKKGKTGYSTAASELDKLRGQHPIINAITQYREVAKLKNTYIDTLPQQVDDQSRVHTTFSMTIAQTGRLSSNDPNLQNIPTRTELGRRIRNAFVAGEGRKFVSADYSQFELRLAAVMAEDTELIDMFNAGADIHTATAAQVYGRELEDVTKQMRSASKAINFGILYGMSPHGLSAAAGMTFEQANNFIRRYKELRQPLFTYMDKVKDFARREGYVETIFGRRRPMPDIHSSNFVVRSAAERAAINMPIQGTEADLMKLAMVEVGNQLRAQHNDCHMLLQIHDSILIECPAEVAERIAKLLKDAMENVYDLPVKLTVDTTIGDTWGDV
jgi:DNA polymerase-1